METVNAITNLISTVGFPIICVVYMWKHISTTQKEFTEAINKNTEMISKLCDKIDDLKEETKEGRHDENV